MPGVTSITPFTLSSPVFSGSKLHMNRSAVWNPAPRCTIWLGETSVESEANETHQVIIPIDQSRVIIIRIMHQMQVRSESSEGVGLREEPRRTGPPALWINCSGVILGEMQRLEVVNGVYAFTQALRYSVHVLRLDLVQ
jgi:hypothetical protein